MRNNSLQIGLLLFGSVILLTSASKLSSFPFFLMNKNKNKRLKGSKEDSEESVGKLTTADSIGLFGIRWRNQIMCSLENEEEDAEPCELEVTNNLDEPILVCWIDPKGILHNFYSVNDGSIKDGSVSNKHLEFTFKNHSFVFLRHSEKQPKMVKDIPKELFIASYVPLKPKYRHCLRLDAPIRTTSSSSFSSLRWGKKKPTISLSCIPIDDEDRQVIVTADKPYLVKSVCGFTLNYESDVFECFSSLQSALEEDLTQLNTLLPPSAVEKLQKGTQLWLNKSLTYGTVKKPVEGTSTTFVWHPPP